MRGRADLSVAIAIVGLLVLPTAASAATLSFDVFPIINTSENQTSLDIIVPDNIIGSYSDGEAVPVLLIMDRLSTEEGDPVHFLSICKNEGNESTGDGCTVDIYGDSLIYSGCDESGSWEGGISAPGGVSVCKGEFISPGGDVLIETRTSNNSLVITLPDEGMDAGVLVITNKPGMDVWAGGNLPAHHPAVKGTASLTDYSEVEWVLETLEGITDSYGNNISTYPIKTSSSLRGEGILVSPKLSSSPSGTLITAKLTYDVYSTAENTIAINDTFDSLDYSIWDVESNPAIEVENGKCRIKASNGLESVLSTKKKVKNSNYTLRFDIMQPSNSIDGYGLIVKHERPEEQNYWFLQLDKNGLLGIYSYKDGWELRNDSVTLTIDKWYRFEITNKAGEANIIGRDEIDTTILNVTVQHDGGSDGKIKFVASSAGGNNVAMFLDNVVLSTGELTADSNGRARGRIFQVPDQNYTVNVRAADISQSEERTVEPEINITYGEESQSGTYSFEKDAVITYDGAYRKQAVYLVPNVTYSGDYIEGSCSVEEETCFKDVIISPGEEKNYTFSWEENGVIIELLDWEQDLSKVSTDELQYVNAPVRVRNIHHHRSYSSIKYDTRGELCEQKNEAGFCTFYYAKLEPLETIIVNHSIEGDWIDVSWGEEEQDMSKNSTIDVQHFRKSITASSTLPITWKDITLEGGFVISFDSIEESAYSLVEDFENDLDKETWVMEESGKIVTMAGVALLQADKDEVTKISTRERYNNGYFVLEADVFPIAMFKRGYATIIDYPRPEGRSYWLLQIDKNGETGVFSYSDDSWSLEESIKLPSLDKWYHFEIENSEDFAKIKIKDGNAILLDAKVPHDSGSAAPIEFSANGAGGMEGFYLDNLTIKRGRPQNENILNAFIEFVEKDISYAVSEEGESVTIVVENNGNVDLRDISGSIPIKRNNYTNFVYESGLKVEYNKTHVSFAILVLKSERSVEIKLLAGKEEEAIQLEYRDAPTGLFTMDPGSAEKSITASFVALLSFLSIRKWKRGS